jgi:hypothetical protein
MKLSRFSAASSILGLLLLAASAKAINVGQIDDFQDGTLANWDNGGAGAPPVLNISTGGPAGAGDHFMQVTSTGPGGPGQFLTVFNRDQWIGDYITPNVTAIEMDLMNLSSVTLTIRLGFKETAGFGGSGYLTSGFTLAPGSGWQHAIFTITEATVIPVGTPNPFIDFFTTGPAETRIINEAGTSDLNGDPVTAQLGVDNIHAVPEPGTALLAMTGLLALAAVCRRKRS